MKIQDSWPNIAAGCHEISINNREQRWNKEFKRKKKIIFFKMAFWRGSYKFLYL